MPAFQSLSDKHRKLARALHLKKHRDDEKLFFAEGVTIVEELLRSSVVAEFVVVQDTKADELTDLLRRCMRKDIDVYTCSARQFEQLSDTAAPQGIAAVARYQDSLNHVPKSCVALDALQDPGNVGTIIRSAHFFGFDSVLLGHNSVDQYNSKLIRAAMGSSFHMNLITCVLSEHLNELRQTHTIVGAEAHAKQSIDDVHIARNFCLVIGAESQGISDAVNAQLHQSFRIDGRGSAESLNASVAAGISLYHFSQFVHS